MKFANGVFTGCLLTVVAQGCSLHKWDDINEGKAGSAGDAGSGGSSNDDATGGKTTKGGASAKGGSSARGGSANQSSSSEKGGTMTTGGNLATTSGTSTTNTGGVESTSGTTAMGGAPTTGGSTATGGTTSTSTTAARACDPTKDFAIKITSIHSDVSTSQISHVYTGYSLMNDGTEEYKHCTSSASGTNCKFSIQPAGFATNDDEPRISRDGLSLFFVRSDSIYLTTRTSVSNAFPAGSALSATVNLGTKNRRPWVSKDGTLIYWSSDNKIYSATITGTGFINVTAATVLNALATPTAPVLTEDLLTVYFSSTQGNTPGTTVTSPRIWKSMRANTLVNWSTPTLVANVGGQYPLDVSPDGCSLYTQSSGIWKFSKPL